MWSFIFFINAINFLTPKIKSRKVIISFPDFDDMTKGLLNYLDGEVIILTTISHVKKPIWLDGKYKVAKKNSLLGFFYLITSSEVFFTHGIFCGFKKLNYSRQKLINMWHGMPLKNIGFLDGKKQVPECHKLMATSVMFQDILSRAFNIPLEDVFVCGLPRNEILLNSAKLDKGIALSGKLILWLPTYRKSKVGDIREDSRNTSLLGFENLDIHKLNNALNEENILLYIKPHPMADYTENFNGLSNIKLINEEWLLNCDITLYEFMSQVDELWTDVSSVFIDFLTLSRPIKFIVPDISDFMEIRGFTFDINSYPLPGAFIKNESELIECIKQEKVFEQAKEPFLDIIGFEMPKL